LGKKAEAFARDEHGITRKENTAFRARSVSDGIKNKHLPRINTEGRPRRGRSISHGRKTLLSEPDA